VLDVLHEPRFVDWAPAQVWAQLLDEQTYLCSPRTMHRILEENAESRERRDQLRHPQYEKPELLATKPNEVWSWDITKLLGPHKWTYYYLYVLLDIFSRYVVGWLLADKEWGGYAKRLIEESCGRQGIEPGQLTIHADRGGVMKGKTLAQLYADLGITRTLSRPHVSNDNPFSEAQFKTLKYRPEFPKRFGSPEHARGCVSDLMDWYNDEHHHSALGWLTPHDVHYGLAEQRLAARGAVLEAAYQAHPERFVHGRPKPPALARAVWINPPLDQSSVVLVPDKDEAEPMGPAPSVLSPARRSGCSSAEPYPPSRLAEGTPATARCNGPGGDHGVADARPHPDVLSAQNLGGPGAEPPAILEHH
jgi:putative transposase